MIEKLGKFETDITKSIGDFKFDFFLKSTYKWFWVLNERIERKLTLINDMVNRKTW